MQSLNNLFVCFLGVARSGIILMKKTVQVRIIGANFGTDEVQKSEEFLQIILKGCPSYKQASSTGERANNLRKYSTYGMTFNVIQTYWQRHYESTTLQPTDSLASSCQ